MASDSLSVKQSGIAQIAACTAKGDLDGLEQALKQGLNCGLSISEIKEVLVQLYAYCGFPRSLNAINTFIKVYDQSRAAVSDAHAPDSGCAAERIDPEVRLQLIKAAAHGQHPELESDFDAFLKEHLFADIFGRGVLSFEDREVVALAALSALDTIRPQGTAAGGSDRRFALSGRQVQDIMNIAGRTCGGEWGLGEENTAYAPYLSGKSYIKPLTTVGVESSHVTFEPGCRHHWHIHHKSEQILYVTSGRGYYQEWGQQVRELNLGDVVNIPPEVKHWLGAAPDSWFSHIALEVPVEGASNEWLEPVDDEQYAKLR